MFVEVWSTKRVLEHDLLQLESWRHRCFTGAYEKGAKTLILDAIITEAVHRLDGVASEACVVDELRQWGERRTSDQNTDESHSDTASTSFMKADLPCLEPLL